MPSKSLERLFSVFGQTEPQFSEEEVLRVNQVISKFSLVYEKVRNAMDYKEDHLLRKNALFRLLKRKLFIEKILINQTEEKLAEQIVYEMIRAGYLKNNQVPKTKIDDLLKVIQKYNKLIQLSDLNQSQFMQMLELQACEIEEVLVPSTKTKALIRFAFEVMNPRILSNRGEIDDKEKELQTYLAVYRVLRKPDEALMSFVLWNLYYPNWHNADDNLIHAIAKDFDLVNDEIRQQLNHPWKKSLDKLFKKFAIVFWILEDLIEKDPEAAYEIFDDEELLEREVRKACDERYKVVRKKLTRGVVRSIVYVFFTKMLLALFLELPLDMLLKGFINYTALTINILFPPVLMFFVAITIRTPGKKNTEMIIKELKVIVFGEDAKKFKLKAPKNRSIVTSVVLNILYLMVFAASVYLIVIGLDRIDFIWTSALIFVFFLSVVSFFGIRIRKPIKEISIEEKRDNIFIMLIDFISLPFATVGQWTSNKFSKINFIAFIFDFIIEAPFKIFVEVLEDLFGFWREKKEEAYDI
ncbi:hypothetical protein A2533_01415 [Candidatus Falkowbacteria bacterium RIFOXYD2_FULL_35_9]|uniref:Uncharacterized protein n=1 Tax=Candidatus Falkowbacteria bacterium RIFOXYC2_FULL_36_12 TaxID=1798002 RepID=A0A1F5T058_9BACT|nr:MAG: hypothetical protein A2300_03415 [Candidatus Falkowbacteria bacterium RIFOXYB2_FULL_35_7]OGF32344.1 MAG: hypothetical protein A2478_03410 [Candidatus Falkowbacteria bacterium RIFOXYC2_FULL_36_12]OGF33239.1 MAG: hypothetical protein A2223_03890 [Candidatus Falkowbacteria bacterium RIFOXYA2_FULL_35_8]OGF47262.1 MAG: hypothetical protein A2533_01415 [Candidatus Falkowbacteria bacterium RIFOXYD2_FULL_35_9]